MEGTLETTNMDSWFGFTPCPWTWLSDRHRGYDCEGGTAAPFDSNPGSNGSGEAPISDGRAAPYPSQRSAGIFQTKNSPRPSRLRRRRPLRRGKIAEIYL